MDCEDWEDWEDCEDLCDHVLTSDCLIHNENLLVITSFRENQMCHQHFLRLYDCNVDNLRSHDRGLQLTHQISQLKINTPILIKIDFESISSNIHIWFTTHHPSPTPSVPVEAARVSSIYLNELFS